MSETIEAESGTAIVDWAARARTGLAAHGKGMRRLNRRIFREMLAQLASGMPLDTVSRSHGFVPESIRAYKVQRPGLWAIIEEARSAGELIALRKIADSSQWQAQDRLLQLQRPEYAPQTAGSQGQPSLAISINISTPKSELPPPIEAEAILVEDLPDPVRTALPAPAAER